MTNAGMENGAPSDRQNPAAGSAQMVGTSQAEQFQAAASGVPGQIPPQYESTSQAQPNQSFSQSAQQYQGQSPQNDVNSQRGSAYQPQPGGQYQFQPQASQQAQQGYTQPGYSQYTQQQMSGQPYNQQPSFGAQPGTPNDHGQEFKHDANMFQHGQLLDVLGGIINGNPDIQKISGLLSSTDTQFWKGAAVGAGAALILGNAAVQSALAGFVGGILSKKTTDDLEEK